MPKKNKVVLLSSIHNDDKIDEPTGDARKPKMITLCNKTKGGVDELCASYTCTLNTRR